MSLQQAFCQSVGKFETPPFTNEDAAIANDTLKFIAVSDGAGGGGVYADCWSRYLVDNLPSDPIYSFVDLDKWLGSIWESFYNKYENEAKRVGGLLLDKFYDEGSFATLVALWKISLNECRWISYGDSVAFCYNPSTKELQHSFTALQDFSKAPYLINCKDELKSEGFRSGTFEIESGCLVFCASDALSHYILSLYEASNTIFYNNELQDEISAHTKNSNFTKAALSIKRIDFEKDVIAKLVRVIKNKHNFIQHLQALEKRGLLAHDDYSLSLLII